MLCLNPHTYEHAPCQRGNLRIINELSTGRAIPGGAKGPEAIRRRGMCPSGPITAKVNNCLPAVILLSQQSVARVHTLWRMDLSVFAPVAVVLACSNAEGAAPVLCDDIGVLAVLPKSEVMTRLDEVLAPYLP